jgi:hypothetical protein
MLIVGYSGNFYKNVIEASYPEFVAVLVNKS